MVTVHTNKKVALLIFTRNPELGKVKTRLAKSIGNEKALYVYQELLAHTRKIASEIEVDRFLFYSEIVIENDLWSTELFQKEMQKGTDLGEKMANAFSFVLDKGYEKAIIIGSDLFDLNKKHINKAILALDNNDIVIGPAEDGGYYLLGKKKTHQSLFENKEWGTSTVLKDTLKNCESLKVHQLEILNDIDTIEDLNKSAFLL